MPVANCGLLLPVVDQEKSARQANFESRASVTQAALPVQQRSTSERQVGSGRELFEDRNTFVLSRQQWNSPRV